MLFYLFWSGSCFYPDPKNLSNTLQAAMQVQNLPLGAPFGCCKICHANIVLYHDGTNISCSDESLQCKSMEVWHLLKFHLQTTGRQICWRLCWLNPCDRFRYGICRKWMALTKVSELLPVLLDIPVLSPGARETQLLWASGGWRENHCQGAVADVAVITSAMRK